jgi:hypothetical protein
MQTLQALDAIVATALSKHGDTLLTALVGLVIAWAMQRRAKIQAASEAGVLVADALNSERVPMTAEQRRAKAKGVAAKISGVAADKLEKVVEQAHARVKRERESLAPPSA